MLIVTFGSEFLSFHSSKFRQPLQILATIFCQTLGVLFLLLKSPDSLFCMPRRTFHMVLLYGLLGHLDTDCLGWHNRTLRKQAKDPVSCNYHVHLVEDKNCIGNCSQFQCDSHNCNPYLNKALYYTFYNKYINTRTIRLTIFIVDLLHCWHAPIIISFMEGHRSFFNLNKIWVNYLQFYITFISSLRNRR